MTTARSDYVSLDVAKLSAGISLTDTDYDTMLADTLIPGVSRQVDDFCHRHFYELVATRKYDFQDSTRLRLWHDLLAITTLTNGDSSELTEDTHFFGYPFTGPPYRWLDIKTDGGKMFQWSGTPQRAISIAGKWGYHQAYSKAWETGVSAVADAAGLNTTGTTVTVASADIFSARETIKINDEQMLITATDDTAETLTVIREINGTTATAHDLADSISRWRVPSQIVRGASEWVSFVLNTVEDAGVSRQRMGDYEQAVSFFLLEQASKGPPGGVLPALRPLRKVEIGI